MRAKAIAVVAGGSLILTACGGGGGDDGAAPPTGEETGGETGGTAADTFTYAAEQEFAAYNANTADQNALRNSEVLNQVLEGFWFFGPDGSIVRNEGFGTYEQVSEDPLTVQYTIGDDVAWSDGEPFDCDDIYLAWVGGSGYVQSEQPVLDDEGEPTDETEQAPLFSTAGTAGLEDSQPPQCEDGDKEFTLVYDQPFGDWQAVFGSGMMPAHVVERESGVEDLIAPIRDQDVETLQPAAEFYNTAWVFNPGELKPDISPALGPYQLDSWQAGQSLTLTANESYWGEAPATPTVTARFIAQDGQAQALQNNEVQLISPQPNVDLVAQLEQLGNTVNVSTHDEYTYEHYDFNFDTAFENRALREAFALCLPRQTIVDSLIVPQNPEAIVLNSRYVFPFEPDYQQVADAITPEEFKTQDVEAARAILEAEGAIGQDLRLGYQTPNPRRSDQAAAVIASCGPDGAGFNVIDQGADDFFGVGLDQGLFEVAMFAWAGSPLVTGASSTFVTGGGNNNGNYSNEEVDALIDQLNQETDLDAQQELIIQIETILWEDLATIPVFTFPALLATVQGVENVEFNATQASITWNMDEWVYNTAQ
jgi:peptide/nickel transport system substrate-binding protein